MSEDDWKPDLESEEEPTSNDESRGQRKKYNWHMTGIELTCSSALSHWATVFSISNSDVHIRLKPL